MSVEAWKQPSSCRKRIGDVSALGRQAERLPGNDAAGEMSIVWEPRGLSHQRGGDRAIAGAAGEHDLPPPRIGYGGRVEIRHRQVERVRIALDRELFVLANVDEQDLAF